MLVLTRHDNEGLTITTPEGHRIQVHILDTHKGKAKVGISAPADCKIVRNKLLQTKDAG